VFIYDNEITLTAWNINSIYQDVYCYISIEWLDEDNEAIIRKILLHKNEREDYNKSMIEKIKGNGRK
jgi:hypothetical protein